MSHHTTLTANGKIHPVTLERTEGDLILAQSSDLPDCSLGSSEGEALERLKLKFARQAEEEL